MVPPALPRRPDRAPGARAGPTSRRAHDTLIAAPTGSGKTLAGFLVCIDRLYRAHERRRRRRRRGTRVVYVSPLKALAVDIAENLERPLAEIAAVAEELGLDAPTLRVAVRTGDTTSSRARRDAAPAAELRRHHPRVALPARHERRAGATSCAPSRPSSSTRSTRSRATSAARTSRSRSNASRRSASSRPQRVGLSATQRPIETVARLLVGDRPLPAIVDAGHQRDLDLALELPEGELEAVTSAEQMGDVLDRIAELVQRAPHHARVRQHPPARRAPRAPARRAPRRRRRRRAPRQPLEGAPAPGRDPPARRRPARARRHRVARARHRHRPGRAGVPDRLAAQHRHVPPARRPVQPQPRRHAEGPPLPAHARRAGRVRGAARRGARRPARRDRAVATPARHPRPADRRRGRARRSGAPTTSSTLVRRAAPFADLDARAVRRGRRARAPTASRPVAAAVARYVHHDAVNGELRGRKGARLAALTSGGAIPETGDYRVVAEPDDTFIGTVNEDWAVESMAGDIFLLGTHSWQIRRVETGRRARARRRRRPADHPVLDGRGAGAHRRAVGRGLGAARTVDELLAAGDPDGARRVARGGGRHRRRSRDDDRRLPRRRPRGARRDAHAASGSCSSGSSTRPAACSSSCTRPTAGASTARSGSRCARSSAARSTSSCRPRPPTTRSCSRSARTTASRSSEVPRYVHSATVDDTLEHAILDSPMFQARWRWNLNRSLHGAALPRRAAGTRRRSSAWRPTTSWRRCSRRPRRARTTSTGPIEIPDHVLVRQTIDDTLHEALDADGLRELLERIETGDVRCTASTPPSRRCSRTRSSPPGRTRSSTTRSSRTGARTRSTLRRGLSVDLASIGALDPEAIEQVHGEITPEPATADDLHDLLASLVLALPASRVASPCSTSSSPRNRAVVLRRDDVEAVVRHRAARPTPSRAVARATRTRSPPVLRGHLEIAGITTVDRARRGHHAPADARRGRARGARARGLRPAGCATRPAPTGTEWVARRLLARMHSYSRRTRRQGVEPATAQDFMRFLLRWQHVAPGTQLAGEAGLVAVLEQLQGFEAAAVAWEPELLARRLRALRARRGSTGSATTARSPGCASRPRPRDDADAPVGAPSKATPITVVVPRRPRVAARSGARRRRSGRAARSARPPRSSRCSAQRGACFAAELGDGHPPAARRHRARAVGRRRPRAPHVRRLRRDPRAGRASDASGTEARRLSRLAARRARCRRQRRPLVARPRRAARAAASSTAHELAEAVAEQLLNRWGVVFRDLALRDSLRFPWRDVQWALRRLEDRGLVRGGRFVTGFSGEQYALPARGRAARADAQGRPHAASGSS